MGLTGCSILMSLNLGLFTVLGVQQVAREKIINMSNTVFFMCVFKVNRKRGNLDQDLLSGS